jgi:hypothetical protein
MNKYIFVLLSILLFSSPAMAVDQTLNDKTATTTATDDDIIHIGDDPGGTYVDKKITFGDFEGQLEASKLSDAADILFETELDSEAELEAQIGGVDIILSTENSDDNDDLTDNSITDLSDVTAISGNTTTVVTSSGSLTDGNCAEWDANGNIVDAGAACGTGSGGDVVDDTTPQLGGDLDVNGQSIISASNGNIVINPDGSGTIRFPDLTDCDTIDTDADGDLVCGSDSGSGSAAGSDTYVQFNDGGTAFGGDAGLTYNKTSDALTVAGTITAGDGLIVGDGTDADHTIFHVNRSSSDATFIWDESESRFSLNDDLYASSVTTAPSSLPAQTFKDSDATDGDVNVQIDANCTDTGSGSEDCDFFIKQQIAGSLTTALTFDADSTIDAARDVTVPDEVYSAGWDSSLEVPTKNAVYDKIETVSGGGDSVSIDGSSVSDPDFVSTGDIDFVDTSNTVTANINTNSVDGTHIALGSDAQGDVMYYDGTDWARLPAGTSGQFLQTQGAGSNPQWATASGSGDITDVFSCSSGDCASITVADGDLLDFSNSNASSTTDGIILPQNTSCASATAEGQVCWDSDDDGLYVGDGAASNEIGASGSGGENFFWVLRPEEAKLPSSNPMSVDAGNARWRGLFDADTAESATWEGVLQPLSGTLKARLYYSMSSATSGTVDFELSVDCFSDGDSADFDTPSFGSADNLSATVPGTAGHIDVLADAGLNGDTCSEGDLIVVQIARDADDGTNDTATGDAELRKVLIYAE